MLKTVDSVTSVYTLATVASLFCTYPAKIARKFLNILQLNNCHVKHPFQTPFTLKNNYWYQPAHLSTQIQVRYLANTVQRNIL
jgi:hypothetical protein